MRCYISRLSGDVMAALAATSLTAQAVTSLPQATSLLLPPLRVNSILSGLPLMRGRDLLAAFPSEGKVGPQGSDEVLSIWFSQKENLPYYLVNYSLLPINSSCSAALTPHQSPTVAASPRRGSPPTWSLRRRFSCPRLAGGRFVHCSNILYRCVRTSYTVA